MIRLVRERDCCAELREPTDPPSAIGWLCTRHKGHRGEHEARDIGGEVIATWPR